jgi:cobaltochelatase CobN
VGSAYGLDEKFLSENGGARVEAPEARRPLPRGRGTASDLLDRLEEATQALLLGLEACGWDVEAAGEVARRRWVSRTRGWSGRCGSRRRRSCRASCGRPDEMGNLLAGLGGGYVPAGPSGSPDPRVSVNVLRRGRNFYSVDPKALPSALSWEVGRGLADDLLRRYLEERGRYPETSGSWCGGRRRCGTQGDDIAEILALLGVRPVWNEESRRVTGLEVIPVGS